MPRTSFSRGLQTGKVVAHEMTGVLLVLTAVLRSAKGRTTIMKMARGQQKEFFPDEKSIRQWVMLLEAQLQLDAWLQLKEMRVDLVERAKTKMKEYMNMSGIVGKRTKGMGCNTLNFHMAKHIPMSILWFGVPSNWDTFANERHHKRDKKTAQRTNKHISKFDIQMARKVQERHAVDLAVEETNGRRRWQYYSVGGFDHSDRPLKKEDVPYFDPDLTGAVVRYYKRENEMKFNIRSKMKRKDKFVYEESTRLCLEEVLEGCSDGVEELRLNTCLRVHDTRAENAT